MRFIDHSVMLGQLFRKFENKDTPSHMEVVSDVA